MSPHLDDAVLSCGLLLALPSRRGEGACVVTVFTEGQGHDRRREEDREAMAILGVDHVHLGLEDAPERRSLARTHAALVEEAELEARDVESVQHAVEGALVAIGRPSVLYVPLGVGRHVDHRTVHAALRDRREAAFYEDRPYALVPGATRARLIEAGLVLAEPEPELAEAPAPGEVERAYDALPHLQRFLGDDLAVRAASLRALAAHHAAPPSAPPGLPSRRVVVRRTSTTPESASRAALAARAYASQGALLPPSLPRAERTYHPVDGLVR
ncbi:MAG: PIG-L family deacetylase [Deltaproteobacteria bacterium]|nr:PIG-L family deacetylase [Deltaproteobacteria bacterium]